jgi:hypothetical protein
MAKGKTPFFTWVACFCWTGVCFFSRNLIYEQTNLVRTGFGYRIFVTKIGKYLSHFL